MAIRLSSKRRASTAGPWAGSVSRPWTGNVTNTVALFLATCLVFADSAVAEPLFYGQTVWERVQTPVSEREYEALRSLERTLRGSGDELDLLRVRAALVDLTRGSVTDPRTVILLLRLRRELGMSPLARAPALLTQALDAPELSAFDRARAHEEYALYLAEGRLGRESSRDFAMGPALSQLDLAMDLSWQAEQRARIANLRAYLALVAGRFSAAESDFELVVAMHPTTELQRLGHTGLALALAGQQKLWVAKSQAKVARELRRTSSSVSGVDPLSSLPLHAEERDALAVAVEHLAYASSSNRTLLCERLAAAQTDARFALGVVTLLRDVSEGDCPDVEPSQP